MKKILFFISLLLFSNLALSLDRNYDRILPPTNGLKNVTLVLDSNGKVKWQSLAGRVFTTAEAVCPEGSVQTDGTAYSRTNANYSTLFAKIGVTHGSGDGSTTFNVPDYRGRFLRMVDGTAGRDLDKATRTAMNTGGNTGALVGSVQLDEFKSHVHRQYIHTSNGTSSAQIPGSGDGNGATSGATYNTYATGGTETRPTNAYVTGCIYL